MSYLDGLKRAIDDEEFAKKTESKQGLRVWNKDMTVDVSAIRVVLEDSSDSRAKGADPNRFFDNSLVQAVNREYASKLFSGEVK
jgi:hypothetical protein